MIFNVLSGNTDVLIKSVYMCVKIIFLKMVVLNLLLFAASLSMSTIMAFPTKDSEIIIKIPDECKRHRLCAAKPEGYEDLENKSHSSVSYLTAKDHDDKQLGTGVRKKRSSNIENCIEEEMQDLLYNYMIEDSVEAVDNKLELIATCPELRRFVKVVKCGQMQSPLSNDSDQQCLQNLLRQDPDLKSSCKPRTARRTLFFFNENKTKSYNRVFDIPVACDCVVG